MAKQKRKHTLKKRYSARERFMYHYSRNHGNLERYGIQFGDRRWCYSMGFVDAFSGRNNESAVRAEDGELHARAYSAGRKRGVKARGEYFSETKKNPADLGFEWHREQK